MADGNKLALTLPSDREIEMTRTFDAPRELVFKAMTDPDLLPQWWGMRGYTTTVDKMDLRPGGAWRYVTRGPESEDAFRGEYLDIVPPERLVYTFEWEGLPGHILTETVTIEERNGKTFMTDRSVFDSAEDRDGMLQSGMEVGANESMDRLAELLEKIS
jgi:uncharacterized protein YndB with AHSA1/START domain